MVQYLFTGGILMISIYFSFLILVFMSFKNLKNASDMLVIFTKINKIDSLEFLLIES